MTQKFPHIAKSVSAHQSVTITGDVYIGENCELSELVKMSARQGRLILGQGVKVGLESQIHSNITRTTIGDMVTIGAYCSIECSIGEKSNIEDNVTLKNSVKVGANCTILKDQVLENIEVPDDSLVKDGQIVQR